MSERAIFSAMAVGVVIGALIVIIAFATGSMFGQRCAKAFPDSGLEQERCIARLSNGERI